MDTEAPAIVLFDGVCNLCNASVQFIIDRDPEARFRFASLQSTFAQALLTRLDVKLPPGDPQSVLLVEGDHLWSESAAALRIARRLRGPVRLLTAGLIVPRPIRDGVYRWVARHRYRWFGRTATCRVPTPELRRRFLDVTS